MLLQSIAELLRLKIEVPGTFKDVPWVKLKKTLRQHGSQRPDVFLR